MPLGVIQHLNIRCVDADATRDFYVQTLGLTVGDRPPFASQGYWLYAGDRPVVHLVQKPAGEAVPPATTGHLDHIGFEAHDLEATAATLEARGVPYRKAVVPRDGSTQLFVRDPNGVTIELNFPPEETRPG